LHERASKGKWIGVYSVASARGSAARARRSSTAGPARRQRDDARDVESLSCGLRSPRRGLGDGSTRCSRWRPRQLDIAVAADSSLVDAAACSQRESKRKMAGSEHTGRGGVLAACSRSSRAIRKHNAGKSATLLPSLTTFSSGMFRGIAWTCTTSALTRRKCSARRPLTAASALS
jgi:hypothetical protein